MSKQLEERITSKTARIAVVGIGYVGLPLAIKLAKIGYTVTGIDKDSERVAKLNSGQNYISDVDEIELKKLVAQGKLMAIENYSTVHEMDIIVICVPTSLTKNLAPDLQYVRDACTEISKGIRKGQFICVESTIYPGTTEEVVLPILERTGLKADIDFYLCHSPERIDPGNRNFTTENINKIVGGIGEQSLQIGMQFYKQIVGKIVPASNVKVAEMAKIYENTFRSVNIALANEFALLCNKMGISVWETLDAAFTKPFGIMPFYPGPGVGGHCIPIDPHYLEWKAREYNYITRFISLAGEINRKMPEYVREIVMQALNKIGIAPSKSKVLMIGMAYKKDVNDYRESPSVHLAELLIKDQIEISYHDPYVPHIELEATRVNSVPLNELTIKQADIVLLTTDHSNIDYQWIVEQANSIIDTRNVTKGIINKNNKIILI